MFQPYFAQDINSNILTEDQDHVYRRIMNMTDPNELNSLVDGLQTEAAIDPALERTEGFQIAAKACIRRMAQMRAQGIRPTKWEGEMPSIFEMVEAAMMGVIIGDEFSKRWNAR